MQPTASRQIKTQRHGRPTLASQSFAGPRSAASVIGVMHSIHDQPSISLSHSMTRSSLHSTTMGTHEQLTVSEAHLARLLSKPSDCCLPGVPGPTNNRSRMVDYAPCPFRMFKGQFLVRSTPSALGRRETSSSRGGWVCKETSSGIVVSAPPQHPSLSPRNHSLQLHNFRLSSHLALGL